MKRFIAVLLAALLTFGMTVNPVMAADGEPVVTEDILEAEQIVNDAEDATIQADSGTCGENLEWLVSGKKVLTIFGQGEMYDYSEEAAPWYDLSSTIDTVIIEEGVTSIGEKAFDQFSSLTNITVPAGVTKIGALAFFGCDNLEDLYFLGTREEWSSIQLESETIPSGCKVHYVVESETGTCGDDLLRWILDDEWTLIITGEGRMFDFSWDSTPWNSYISDIKKIDIKSGIENIGAYAFAECSNVTSVSIPNTVTDIGEMAFYACSALTNITLPEGLVSIGKNAFYNCSSLVKINIPASVASIGELAFDGCSALSAVYITDLAKWCGITFASAGSNPLTYAHSLYLNNEPVISLVIPEGVTTICDYAFYYSNISDLAISESVTSIGNYSFHYCNGLTSVTIPGNVKKIGGHAFAFCSNLNSFSAQDGMESIGENAFEGCNQLTSVTLPDSVTSIGSYAFNNCTELTRISIPAGLTNINGFTFNGCTNLARVTIPDGVTSIGLHAFYNCKHLTSINLPESVTSIEGAAFYNCQSLTGIIIPEGITEISDKAFAGCSSLVKITIPENVQIIELEAFNNCSSLVEVTIPYTVKSIGDKAFEGCNNLTDLYYKGAEEDWNNINFGSEAIPSTCTIHYLHTHDWKLDGFTWEGDENSGYTSAHALFVCSNNPDHKQSVEASITVTTTTEPTCEETGTTLYTATATFEEETYTDNKEAVLPALGHDYKFSHWEWVGDDVNGYTAAFAVFDCSRNPEHVHKVEAELKEERVEPTCDASGSINYTATVTFDENTYTDSRIIQFEPTAHDYEFKGFEWSGDENSGYTAHALFVCRNNPEHKQSVEASITVTTTTEPTCEETGTTLYTATATFEEEAYTDTKEVPIEPLGHDYQFSHWEWVGDDVNGYTAAYAVFNCSRDPEHIHKAEAELKEERAESTCDSWGYVNYTATVTYDEKTYTDSRIIQFEPTAHDYEFKGFEWSEDDNNGYTALALFVCRNNPDHKQTVEALIMVSTTKEPTCEETGTALYTASVTFEGETYTDTKEAVLSALGHDYQFSHFDWVGDDANGYTGATAVFACTHDASHTQSVEANVSSETTEPTCDTAGKTVYTATASFNGITYTDTKEVAIPALGHDYEVLGWLWTGNIEDGFSSVKTIFSCKHNPDHLKAVDANVVYEYVEPTCESAGRKTYTATAELDGKTYTDKRESEIAALGHDYKLFNWEWTGDEINGYTAAAAIFKCSHDEAHTQSVEASLNIERQEPTCEEAGYVYYTATVEFNGATYTDKKEVTLQAFGHDYMFTGFTWTGDDVNGYTFAEANYVCRNDEAHTDKVAADITSEETEDKIIYTATVSADRSLDGVEHSETKEIATTAVKIIVTTDKESYDFRQSVHVKAEVINAEETEENLASSLTFTITDSEGTPLSGYVVQSLTGLSGDVSFPLLDESMEEGTYKIVVEKVIDSKTVSGECSFHYTGYQDIPIDYTGYSIKLTIDPEILAAGDPIVWTAHVEDADGNPAAGVKVLFSLYTEAGKLIKLGGYDYIYNVTDADGDTALKTKFSGTLEGALEKYRVNVQIEETSIFDNGWFTFIGTNNFALDKTSVTASLNGKVQLNLVNPDGVKGPGVWTSSDESVATVDENGLVSAIGIGKATIHVKMGNYYEGDCEVEVLFRDVKNKALYYFDPVYWAAEKGITKGYSDGSFGIGRNCTRRELMIFLWRYAGEPTKDKNGVSYGDARNLFNDVKSYGATSATNKAIAWAYKEGIVKGYADGGFHPEASIVRKDVMIMLYRFAGKPSISGTLTFTDCKSLKQSSDTYKAILWGSTKGITNGYTSGQYKGQFGINLDCLREQIVTFLYRYETKVK